MADNEDVNTLKRRGRRRLVGAIALVLAAVIVLPMVFDSEPRGSAPPVSVRIPAEDETGFTPKVTPKSPAVQEQKAPEKTAEKAPDRIPDKAPEKAPEAQPEKPSPKIEVTVKKGSDEPAARAPETEKKRAEAALAGAIPGEQFIIPAGAYVDPAGTLEKLKAARIPHYTEPIATKDGTVTRVRAGPFVSREAAEKALQQLKGLGLKPGNVAAKS
ncbi:MAG: SPOR domain-containing protein [Candidatus Parcubacteria bacterium]|nr:SPOR domain-containing protein [Burkholderiales bacterium]